MALSACLTMVGAGSGATAEALAARFHPSAVKGQKVELEILAPSSMVRMTLSVPRHDNVVDTSPPFRFTFATDEMRPAHYKWHSWAKEATCCAWYGAGGAIQVYPLPRLRTPKVSALVVAGTARVVGLVVSRIGPNRIVRAWAFPRDAAGATNAVRLPLDLRQRRRHKRVYRFPNGRHVTINRRTEIAVEVAPAKRTLRHGVEIRGRLASIWLTRNRRNGAIRSHRGKTVGCTTIAARKEGVPGRVSCTKAPPEPAVAIVCERSVRCKRGTPAGTPRQD